MRAPRSALHPPPPCMRRSQALLCAAILYSVSPSFKFTTRPRAHGARGRCCRCPKAEARPPVASVARKTALPAADACLPDPTGMLLLIAPESRSVGPVKSPFSLVSARDRLSGAHSRPRVHALLAVAWSSSRPPAHAARACLAPAASGLLRCPGTCSTGSPVALQPGDRADACRPACRGTATAA